METTDTIKLIALDKTERMTIGFVLLDALDDTRTKYDQAVRAERGTHQLGALRAIFPTTADHYIKEHGEPTTW